METDTELFLNLIRECPALYAVGHAEYKNTYKKEIAWRKIQEKTGLDVKTMKIKWRNLKDTYKKYKQCQQISSGQAAKKLTNWVWADQMSFIDSSINLRQTDSTLEASGIVLDTATTNVSIENENENLEQVPNNEQDGIRIVPVPETKENSAKQEEISRRRRRVSSSDPADKIINYLNTRRTANTGENSGNLAKITCDRIDMEFLGYANTVKKLSLHKQAIVKLQIANIITQAQLQELNNSQPLSNSSSCNTTTNPYYFDDSSNVSTMQSTEQPSKYTDIAQIYTYLPNTETQSVPTFLNTGSQNLTTTAQIHMPNTPISSAATFINTDSQNLSSVAKIHIPDKQTHSNATFVNTSTQNLSTTAQIHTPSTQIHLNPFSSGRTVTHSQLPKIRIQKTRVLKNVGLQDYISTWKEQ